MEREALAAESELKKSGQLANSPEARDRAERAIRLRRAADDYLTAILQGKPPAHGEPFLDSEPEAS